MGDDVKIGIIGGGAVGLLFGAYYSSKYTVTIFSRTKEQSDVLNSKGIILTRQNNREICNVAARSHDEQISEQNMVIVAVKQYDLDSILPILLNTPKQCPLLFIQNGMGHLDFFEKLPHETIFVGTVEHGAKRETANEVNHTGIGVTNIALYRGRQEVIDLFPIVDHTFFPIQFVDQVDEMLQAKLIANAVINPLTAVLSVKNGELIKNTYFFALFQKLHKEIISVLPNVDERESFRKVEAICTNTKENWSSMYKDINGGGKTEIDSILGYVLNLGEEQGRILPLAKILYTMIKGLEQERGIKSDG
ncbi:2-dehydropantoate 2-reductase [Bacillus niameyensis]|uniref:2-dehydropantoate 2-reductase n=1 Tax=Bacillus niameyensis TaxID=1522308 RepID=UPI000A04D4C8|nr:2-dehydropantoate 2-reductase [Bacillus niameyensis]